MVTACDRVGGRPSQPKASRTRWNGASSAACRRQRLAAGRVHKGHGSAGQQQAMAVILRPEKPVVYALAVFGITNQRIAYMFHVTPQLVPASRFGLQGNKAVTGLGVALHREGKLYGGQPPVAGDGILRGQFTAAVPVRYAIALFPQRVIDTTFLRAVPAHHGQIVLAHPACGKLAGQLPGAVAGECRTTARPTSACRACVPGIRAVLSGRAPVAGHSGSRGGRSGCDGPAGRWAC